MAVRSPEIPVSEWWLAAARELLEEDKRSGRNLTELGKDLQRQIKRAKPFSHSVLSRFKAGEIGVTLDLHDALVREFAESREEALDLMHTVSRYRTGRPLDSRQPAPVVPIGAK